MNNYQLTQGELTLTNKLQEEIIAAIVNNDGSIPISKFTELALYHKEYGYYNNLLFKFGNHGDFITSPMISKSFAYAVSNQVQELFNHLNEHNILEIGAGNGQFMLDILSIMGDKIDNYYILDLSANLIALQQKKLQEIFPQFVNKVKWIHKLPTDFMGVIFANEVLDAQPCDSYIFNNRNLNRFEVQYQDNQFGFIAKSFHNDTIIEIIDKLPKLVLQDDYVIDINLNNRGFIKSITNCLTKGCVLFIDYGYGETEFYSLKHSLGTIRGFFRHTMLDNILIHPGLIDITSSVNFTAIATTGISCGLDLIDYTTQGSFLLNCGILDYKNTISQSTIDEYKWSNQINQLTGVNNMGEVFKVIGFSKNVNFCDWLGFKNFSQSHLL